MGGLARLLLALVRRDGHGVRRLLESADLDGLLAGGLQLLFDIGAGSPGGEEGLLGFIAEAEADPAVLLAPGAGVPTVGRVGVVDPDVPATCALVRAAAVGDAVRVRELASVDRRYPVLSGLAVVVLSVGVRRMGRPGFEQLLGRLARSRPAA